MDLGVGDFPATVGWDLVIGNGKEGVGAFDALAFIGTGADSLASVYLHRRYSR